LDRFVFFYYKFLKFNNGGTFENCIGSVDCWNEFDSLDYVWVLWDFKDEVKFGTAWSFFFLIVISHYLACVFFLRCFVYALLDDCGTSFSKLFHFCIFATKLVDFKRISSFLIKECRTFLSNAHWHFFFFFVILNCSF